MDLPWVLHDYAVTQIGHEQPLSQYLAQADNRRRADYQAFIQQRFAAHHGARVRHFMPCLQGLGWRTPAAGCSAWWVCAAPAMLRCFSNAT